MNITEKEETIITAQTAGDGEILGIAQITEDEEPTRTMVAVEDGGLARTALNAWDEEYIRTEGVPEDEPPGGFIENEQPIYYTYKDRVFRLLFRDKKRLLELYNALNNTSYTNENDLTVNTLENAIFMKMKNDISFVIGCDMSLYEHQSTYCPNMPLRGFLYFADLYKKHIKDIDLSVRKRIMIPAPHYIVFYNGIERKEEEFTQKLSDSFEDAKEGCIELTVRTININYGHNKELMDRCKSLADYAYFIAEIRKNLKDENKPLKKAVEEAIEICIRKNVLREFLIEQKAEVIAMSIYEYNEEYVNKTLYEDGYDTGYGTGYDAGHAEGSSEGSAETLIRNVESVMTNANVDLREACRLLGISVEEYYDSKKLIELIPTMQFA